MRDGSPVGICGLLDAALFFFKLLCSRHSLFLLDSVAFLSVN